jgi:hypothetical protein
LAGFLVTAIGRFWVTAEAIQTVTDLSLRRINVSRELDAWGFTNSNPTVCIHNASLALGASIVRVAEDSRGA